MRKGMTAHFTFTDSAFRGQALRVSAHTFLLLTILLLPATAQTPPTTSGAPTNASSADNDVTNPLPAIWFADRISAKQLEVATDRITQIIPLAHEARALAVDPNNKSLWVLSHKNLLKFDAQTSLILDLDLKTLLSKPIKKDNKEKKEKDSREEYEEIEETDQFVLNPYDSSLWIGAGKILLHLDSQGKLLFTWRASEKIEALALSLDESLWLLGKKQLLHLSAQGTVLDTYPLKPLAGTEDGHFRFLAIDALSGILWLASEDTLYQTNLADLLVKPPVRIYPTPSQTAISHEEEGEDTHENEAITNLALDLPTGTLWVTTKHTLLSFNRSGALLTTLALRPQGLKRADILAFDPPTQSLWLGGKKTLAHFSNDGSLIAKISLDEKLRALGITPFKLTPGITLLQPLPDALSNNAKLPIRLGLSAICNNASCNIDSAYLNAFVFSVTLNNTQIGNLFTNTHGEATYIPSERYPEGVNTFTAQARDGFGHISNILTGHFTIDTIAPKFLSLMPADGSTITTAAITIQGTLDDPTASVMLLDGAGRARGTTSGASFHFAVTLSTGANPFTLIARDQAGNATSVPLTLNYSSALAVMVTSIASGATVSTDSLHLSGSFGGPENTGVTVNGVIAVTAGGKFYVNNLPLQPGSNTLIVTATTPDGQTASQTLTVFRTGGSPFHVTVAPQSGIAPLNAAFTVTGQTPNAITQIAVDFDGNGTIDFTTTDSAAPITFTYNTPGVHQPRITATDSQGATASQILAVVVYDAAQMDKLFETLWNGMNSALQSGDTAGASRYLNESAKLKYKPVFDALLPNMPQIIASYSPLTRISISENIGEYAINRSYQGQNRLYLMYFLKDADGVWRVDAM